MKAIKELFVLSPGKNSPAQTSLSVLEHLSGKNASIELESPTNLKISPSDFVPSSK